MKDETGGVATAEFAGLKPKMYPLLVDDKCLRHLMNRIQSKYHQIGTQEINKISLMCFHDKLYILNKRFDGLALGY